MDIIDTIYEPIMEFKNEEQACISLMEWKTKLFLNDWTIKVTLCDPHEFYGKNRVGECEVCESKTCAAIRILKKEYYPNDAIEKYCAEQIIVHELLHCLIILFEKQDPTIEEVFFNTKSHQLIEQMSKSLIMAKYNIGFDWFKNF